MSWYQKKVFFIFVSSLCFFVRGSSYRLEDLAILLGKRSCPIPYSELAPIIKDLQPVQEGADLFCDSSQEPQRERAEAQEAFMNKPGDDFDYAKITKTFKNEIALLQWHNASMQRRGDFLYYCEQAHVFYRYWGPHLNKYHPHYEGKNQYSCGFRISARRLTQLLQLWGLAS